jgi:hypothetical protein
MHKGLKVADTGAMAGTGESPKGSPEGPDDINDRLAEIAAELASEARFKEPSAAERARARAAAARAPGKGARGGQHSRIRRWRARKKAEELRRPVDGSGAIINPPPKPPTARQVRRTRRTIRPVADRGYTDGADYPSVARSIIAVIVIIVLLVGISIGLRYLFRHYGGTSGASGRAAVVRVVPASSTSAYLIK